MDNYFNVFSIRGYFSVSAYSPSILYLIGNFGYPNQGGQTQSQLLSFLINLFLAGFFPVRCFAGF